MIKAIETEYNGYRFRSRLEARWAVFFDALGMTWGYEVEGFDLGSLGRYLPDFDLGTCWAEIKPQRDEWGLLEADRYNSMARMGRPEGKRLLLLEGDPFEHKQFVFSGSIFQEFIETTTAFSGSDSRDVAAAARKARGARFEFGEAWSTRGRR